MSTKALDVRGVTKRRQLAPEIWALCFPIQKGRDISRMRWSLYTIIATQRNSHKNMVYKKKCKKIYVSVTCAKRWKRSGKIWIWQNPFDIWGWADREKGRQIDRIIGRALCSVIMQMSLLWCLCGTFFDENTVKNLVYWLLSFSNKIILFFVFSFEMRNTHFYIHILWI